MPTPQRPIGSPFGVGSTASEVIEGVDLSGYTAIVTGGYSGIGLETVRVLRSAGARVTVPARDLAKARSALAEWPDVEISALDLIDPESVETFAKRFLDTDRPLHLLINNAGVMACPLTRDARGYEAQFATNHLGHFQLTTRLWPALLAARGARVVNLTSRGHFFSPMVFDDPNYERRDYDPWRAYGQSKTANILFSVALDARGAGDGVRAFAVHPGSIIDTDLKRHLTVDLLKAVGALDNEGRPAVAPNSHGKTIAQGAATTVWCAVSPSLADMGGVYCEDSDIALPVPPEFVEKQATARGLIRPTGVMPYAIDEASAKRLWKLSEELLGRT